MATIITVASGNGGVGKSVVASNLGLLLSREGWRVVLVDVDGGGANLHILLGMFQPMLTLTDFYSRKVASLEDIAQTVGWGSGLRLIPGAEDALSSSNPSDAEYRRLIRHLRHMNADIIILDCASGINHHTLEIFLLGDYQMVVATPDPTSIIALYRLIKVAAMRKVMNVMRDESLEDAYSNFLGQEFDNWEEIIQAAKEWGPSDQSRAKELARAFQPLFILNRTTAQTKMSISYLQKVVARFIGSELVFLGEIPQNDAVEQSRRVFSPIVDFAPKSSAAKAFTETASTLLHRLEAPEAVLVS